MAAAREARGARRRGSLRAALPIALAVLLAPSAEAGGLEATTTRVGLFAGLEEGAPRTPKIAGTDLGHVTRFGPLRVVLFGDTFRNLAGDENPGANDAVGVFLGGDADTVPEVHFSHWADLGPDLDMGGARTPTGAAQFGGWQPWYAMFLRGGVFAKCSSDADCHGLVCDESMGLVDTVVPDVRSPCWRDAQTPCPPVDGDPSRGLCRDPTSSLADYEAAPEELHFDPVDGEPRTAQGKNLSVAMPLEFGPYSFGGRYQTVEFVTNKLLNSTMRSTRSFRDYRPPRGFFGRGWSALWIWGRPGFWSNEEPSEHSPVRDAESPIYLALTFEWLLPDPARDDRLAPLFYYAGKGRFSRDQSDAVPLPAEGGWEDGVMQQQSVTYVEGLRKWVMLYGGGMPRLWDALFGGELAASLRAGPGNDLANVRGAIKMRTADHPWGPWSEPTEVLHPADAAICDVLHRGCSSTPQNSPWFPNRGADGVVYSASLVRDWTEWDPRERTLTLGWLVSTFNPYKVHQMKTVVTGL